MQEIILFALEAVVGAKKRERRSERQKGSVLVVRIVYICKALPVVCLGGIIG